jgi:hypothetical protein
MDPAGAMMKRRTLRGKGIFVALVAAASLLLQPVCGAFAALAAPAPVLLPAQPASTPHGDVAGHPVPGNASCCSERAMPTLAGPPSMPDATPHAGPSALSAPIAPSPSMARAWAGAGIDIAWANAPPPLPFHSRSSRILR